MVFTLAILLHIGDGRLKRKRKILDERSDLKLYID
jgi:hypothetical protein